jgi:hypothetical protein
MGSVVLHHGTGAQDFGLDGEPLPADDVRRVFFNAKRILVARGETDAVALLDAAPFRIVPASNHFNDEFHVLHAQVPLAAYETFRTTASTLRVPARSLADVISEVGGPHIRFVAVQLLLRDPDTWDVFLCHASEDKAAVAQPLFDRLELAGIRCWYDQAEIAWGESLVSKIQTGLSRAHFVIVVLSLAFLAKRWAQKELRTALTLELEGRDGIVLPLIVGDPARVLETLPFLSEKLYVTWTGDPTDIERRLRVLLQRKSTP